MHEFYLSKNNAIDINKVVKNIQDFGICVIPNFIQKDCISQFQDELEQIFNNEKHASFYAPGVAVRLKNSDIFADKYPLLSEIFNSKWLYNIWYTYFKNHRFRLSEDIFCSWEYKVLDKSEWSPNMYLHADKGFRAKLMIYGNNVNKNNGAFSVLPGEHYLGKQIRERAWKQTSDYSKLENKIIEDYPELGFTEEDAIPIELEAGGAFLFITDLPHKASPIKENGLFRKIVRSHTY